jgi:hypothetical protein
MQKLQLLSVYLILIVGCKTLPPTPTDASVDRTLRPRLIQQQIVSNSLTFKTLQWRGQAQLERNGKRQKISLTSRLKQGEGIWLNGTVFIPLARVFITPTQLQFYEKINQQFAQIDYRELRELLDVSVSYTMLENILTGKALEARMLKRATLSYTKETYVWISRRKGVEMQFVYDTAFRLIEQTIRNKQTTLRVSYGSYKKLDDQWIPEQLIISLLGDGSKDILTLRAKNSQLNQPLTMPFEIPKGYKTIRIQ